MQVTVYMGRTTWLGTYLDGRNHSGGPVTPRVLSRRIQALCIIALLLNELTGEEEYATLQPKSEIL